MRVGRAILTMIWFQISQVILTQLWTTQPQRLNDYCIHPGLKTSKKYGFTMEKYSSYPWRISWKLMCHPQRIPYFFTSPKEILNFYNLQEHRESACIRFISKISPGNPLYALILSRSQPRESPYNLRRNTNIVTKQTNTDRFAQFVTCKYATYLDS